MATIEVNPLYLNSATISIGTDSYEKAISGVTLTPSSSTSTWMGLSIGSVFSATSLATWVCGIDYAQDLDNAESLANYLHANEGQTATITGVLGNGATPSTVTAQVTIVPGTIGGKGQAWATSSASLPVQGKPTITPHTA